MQRDGLEAVDKINHEPDRFNLIFMDIIMPNLDGVSATAMIRMVAPRSTEEGSTLQVLGWTLYCSYNARPFA